MTRIVAKRGFDMELAASYQLWGAFLTPIMIPLLIGVADGFTGAISGCHQLKVLAVMRQQQFVHCYRCGVDVFAQRSRQKYGATQVIGTLAD